MAAVGVSVAVFLITMNAIALGSLLVGALRVTAASTNLLRPPTDRITLLVAGSIVITALDNIRPFLPGPRAGVAALFGLIHGFGFATVLSGSAMAGGMFATALLGGKVLLWLGSAAGVFWISVALGRL